MATIGRRIRVRGTVQGVGFRPWVYRLARRTGVAGRVLNDAAGVTIEAFGSEPDVRRFLDRLAAEPPPAAVIERIDAEAIPPEATPDFVIVSSEAAEARRVSIPPDLATCDDCLRELFDPGDRRYRHPFITCTNCGPRYTIARDVPYDRETTTMASFAMCPACRADYTSPDSRRFHAEPIACPACGPSLALLDADGRPVSTADPIEAAARALDAGLIVAVKGLGGFHLACSASSAAAVAALRARKRREQKPLAVMVADLDAAERLALLTDDERRLLESPVRPIVLVLRREQADLADAVAPGNPYVGLMLPYTPLHHLLLRAVRAPLVMTSGNLSEEPLAYRNDEAVERLRGIADLFVVHDRDIETPCDDSVVRLIAGRTTLLRRSRGYVPRPVRLPGPVARPTLGCGALLKNTFCLARGNEAWLGPHVGDLDNLATHRFFEAAIARFERFLRIRPEVVAHDLHPEYHSTRFALARDGVTPVGVQHHHAHVAAAMAEHRLEEPVLGVAYDGTGLGPDGTAWGGELLLAWYDRFERLATFRPIRLAGGDAAIRQVWRLALALVIDAFGRDAPIDRLPLFRQVPDRDLLVVGQLLEGGIQTVAAHGVGRYFDAFGALGLGLASSAFEGQVAMAWNHAAHPHERGRYTFDIDTTGRPWLVDFRDATREAVRDLLAREPASLVSARFHNTLAAATAAVVERAAAEHGPRPVVLTGGCFQNPRLASGIRAALAGRLAVHLHREVPPGDGGLALGQVMVACAVLERGGARRHL
jgi:hydrogenase maturation protein HypF